MSLKEFYEKVGGSYESMMGRVFKEERAIKYLKMFKSDESMSQLHDGLKKKDYQLAFTGIHTLKGITANLSLDEFYTKCCELTEILRHYDGADYSEALKNVDEKYKEIIEAIDSL